MMWYVNCEQGHFRDKRKHFLSIARRYFEEAFIDEDGGYLSLSFFLFVVVAIQI